MIRNEYIQELFFNTKHCGVLDCQQPLTFSSRIYLEKTKCLEMYITYTSEQLIQYARFRASGNPYLIAGLEWVCRQLENNLWASTTPIDYQTIMQNLQIPTEQYPLIMLISMCHQEIIRHSVNSKLANNGI